jgi:putative transposase
VTLQCHIRDASLREIRVSPYYGNYLVCLCYQADEDVPGPGSSIAAVDFGVDNIMTVTSDTGESVIFKGGAVKSMNQWFNKRRAELTGIITKGHPTVTRPSSRQLEALSMRRAEWMHDTFQKMSSRLIEWCLAHRIGTIVLGINRGWKQRAGIGTRNNQTFVGIPFYSLQMMIRYKAERAGILVEEQEESYTSKVSFLDNDRIPVYGDAVRDDTFSGCRIHRGLYRSKGGIHINADINGAANILRKWGADTSTVLLSNLQRPAVIRQLDLNTRIPVKGIGAA